MNTENMNINTENMDAEMRRFLKSFMLHSSRICLYAEEELNRKHNIAINNSAKDALFRLSLKVKENPDKYSDLLLELMKSEDPKVRASAVIMCLHWFVHFDTAVEVGKALLHTTEFKQAFLFNLNLALAIAAARREKKELDQAALNSEN